MTGGEDKKLRLFNVADGKLVRTVEGLPAAIKAVDIQPNNQKLAAGGSDNVVRLFNAADGMPAGELTGHTAAITDLAYLPNGTQLVSSGDTHLRFWKAPEGTLVRAVNTAAPVTCLAVSRTTRWWPPEVAITRSAFTRSPTERQRPRSRGTRRP